MMETTRKLRARAKLRIANTHLAFGLSLHRLGAYRASIEHLNQCKSRLEIVEENWLSIDDEKSKSETTRQVNAFLLQVHDEERRVFVETLETIALNHRQYYAAAELCKFVGINAANHQHANKMIDIANRHRQAIDAIAVANALVKHENCDNVQLQFVNSSLQMVSKQLNIEVRGENARLLSDKTYSQFENLREIVKTRLLNRQNGIGKVLREKLIKIARQNTLQVEQDLILLEAQFQLSQHRTKSETDTKKQLEIIEEMSERIAITRYCLGITCDSSNDMILEKEHIQNMKSKFKHLIHTQIEWVFVNNDFIEQIEKCINDLMEFGDHNELIEYMKQIQNAWRELSFKPNETPNDMALKLIDMQKRVEFICKEMNRFHPNPKSNHHQTIVESPIDIDTNDIENDAIKYLRQGEIAVALDHFKTAIQIIREKQQQTMDWRNNAANTKLQIELQQICGRMNDYIQSCQYRIDGERYDKIDDDDMNASLQYTNALLHAPYEKSHIDAYFEYQRCRAINVQSHCTFVYALKCLENQRWELGKSHIVRVKSLNSNHSRYALWDGIVTNMIQARDSCKQLQYDESVKLWKNCIEQCDDDAVRIVFQNELDRVLQLQCSSSRIDGLDSLLHRIHVPQFDVNNTLLTHRSRIGHLLGRKVIVIVCNTITNITENERDARFIMILNSCRIYVQGPAMGAFFECRFPLTLRELLNSLCKRLVSELTRNQSELLYNDWDLICKVIADTCTRWRREREVNDYNVIDTSTEETRNLAWRTIQRLNQRRDDNDELFKLLSIEMSKHSSIVELLNRMSMQRAHDTRSSLQTIDEEYALIDRVASYLNDALTHTKPTQHMIHDAIIAWDKAMNWGEACDVIHRQQIANDISTIATQMCIDRDLTKQHNGDALCETLIASLMEDNVVSCAVFRKLKRLRDKNTPQQEIHKLLAQQVSRYVLASKLGTRSLKLLSKHNSLVDEDPESGAILMECAESQAQIAYKMLCNTLSTNELTDSLPETAYDVFCEAIVARITKSWAGPNFDMERAVHVELKNLTPDHIELSGTHDDDNATNGHDQEAWNEFREDQLAQAQVLAEFAVEYAKGQSRVASSNALRAAILDVLLESSDESNRLFETLFKAPDRSSWNTAAKQEAWRLVCHVLEASKNDADSRSPNSTSLTSPVMGRPQHDAQTSAESEIAQWISKQVHLFLFKKGTQLPKRVLQWIERIVMDPIQNDEYQPLLARLAAQMSTPRNRTAIASDHTKTELARSIARQLKSALPELQSTHPEIAIVSPDAEMQALHAVHNALREFDESIMNNKS